MHPRYNSILLLVMFLAFVLFGAGNNPAFLGTFEIASSQDGKLLYIAQKEAKRIDVFDIEKSKTVDTIELRKYPTGLILGMDNHLIITAGIADGVVYVVDLNKNKVKDFKVGHSPISPQLSPDGKTLYICNRFANQVVVINLKKKKVETTIETPREPTVASLTPDGKWLVVGNHLPDQAANSGYSASKISLIDTQSRRLVNNILLPNGSSGVRGITISHDGKYAFVTHILGRYTVPTTQLEQGWMNTNALSIIDIENQQFYNAVLLDDLHHGAANPWGVELTADGKTLCISHAGTHEVSVIEVAKLFQKIEAHKDDKKYNTEPYNLLSYLYGFRERVKIPGKGPRGMAIVGNQVFTGDYFSGTLSRFDLTDKRLRSELVVLGQNEELSQYRQGELFFNDASLCFQKWQSCASCHPDARVDGLNWDLLNDGIGNPKNVKSMYMSHKTPPGMSTAVRADAETAVRAGIRYIQFAVRPDEDAQAIDEYLENMPAVPSPYLVKGKLSKSAKRGEKLFKSDEVGCINCHPEPLYTDLLVHNVGTASTIDSTTNKSGNRVAQLEYDTPSLKEVWRSGPYLHDGRYTDIKQVITEGNHGDMRGKTSHLSKKEINDLVEFVKSL
jgi:YVTN family beta-propeller protein